MPAFRFFVFLLLAGVSPCRAELPDLGQWDEGVGSGDGASRDYFNRAAKLKWKHFMGDWVDALGVEQGGTPLSKAETESEVIRLDVSQLARIWHQKAEWNRGAFLKALPGSAAFSLHSREAEDPSLRPRLDVVTNKGEFVLEAVADTYLDKSTYRSLGTASVINISGVGRLGLIRFDLGGIGPEQLVREATLIVQVAKRSGRAPIKVGAFRAMPGHDPEPQLPKPGLASAYIMDEGLIDEPGVLHVNGFENGSWGEHWGDMQGWFESVSDGVGDGFVPLSGKALRVTVPKGGHLGLNSGYYFEKQNGKEPEEIYFRYYLRFGESWKPVDVGKLPGISGTYDKSGWGGRKVNGSDGWSARGLFAVTAGEHNVAGGHTATGSYVYHPDAEGNYGSHWYWEEGQRGVLDRNRWYCIEHYVKLNSPGEHDGVIKGWIDGRQAFERSNIRFRDVPQLKIEKVWLNVYHGGKKVPAQDTSLFLDNLVIAKNYIGPMVSADQNGKAQMDWWFESR